MRVFLRLASVFGLSIRGHVTFLTVLGLAALGGWSQGGALGALLALQTAAVAYGIHEAGHALAALLMGFETGRTYLYWCGGVYEVSADVARPWQEVVVALGGPASNLLMAALLAWNPEGSLPAGTPLHHWMLWANLALGLINLVPAYPADGGVIVAALLSLGLERHRADQATVSVSRLIGLSLGGLGLLKSPLFLGLGLLFWLGARLGIHDPHLPCYNKRHFFLLVEKALLSSRERGDPVSLVVLDLDHTLETSWFHTCHDSAVVVRVCQALGLADVLGRYEVDGYALLLEGADKGQALQIAERVRTGVASDTDRDHPGLTASFGVATLTPDIPDANALAQGAFDALRQAKEGGRNRTVSHP